MNQRFKSRHAPLLLWVLALAQAALVLVVFLPDTSGTDRLVLGGLELVIGSFTAAILLRTYYFVDGSDLCLKMAVFGMKVPIASIRKMEIGNHLWYAGSKFATSWKNTILITYNKYDEVLLSPADVEGFIAALKAVHPDLEIVHK